MSCPCKNCICVVICRTKQFPHLFFECPLIFKFIKEPFQSMERDNGKIGLVYRYLKPTHWHPTECERTGKTIVDNYTGYANCHFLY